MLQRTPLYQQHLASGGKIVPFAGWELPIHYGSQLQEHHFVRQDAGVFDVSHMTITDLHGPEAQAFLRYLLANDVAKLQEPGMALYTCMLNERGGILDDLIVYRLGEEDYRLVTNAATRAKDRAWIEQESQAFDVQLQNRDELTILAVQGPQALAKLQTLCGKAPLGLKPFRALAWGKGLIARTGYTGEDGVEIMLPATEVEQFWQDVLRVGVHPCGLGARDTLRLEAGLNLYGSDMDETVTPAESNLSWTIALADRQREFIGRAVVEKEAQQGAQRCLVGLMLEQKGVLRNHQRVCTEHGEGEVTSGSFSPTLNCGFGLARVPAGIGEQCEVEVHQRGLPARVVVPPFVRRGQAAYRPWGQRAKEVIK